MKLFITITWLILVYLPLFSQSTDSVRFLWKWEQNQVLELNEYHDILFRVGKQSVAREDRNRVLLKTTKCDTNGCNVDAWFDTYIRYGKTDGPFQKDKDFKSSFIIFRSGRYQVPDQYVMPNLRSFPTFPDSEISVGDSWKLPAEESFDFLGKKMKIVVEPDYNYLGKGKWQFQGKSGYADKISYTYPIFFDGSDLKQTAKNVPRKIFGFGRGVVYFSANKGLPEYKELKLSYTFVLPDGTIQEANFNIRGIYETRKSLNTVEKEKVTEDVIKDLIVGDEGHTNPASRNSKKDSAVSVRTTEDGVTFSLDSILFDFNDSKLKPAAEEAVKKIATILKKYPNREIRVSGHTDNTGKKEYNQKLSEDRAKSVLHQLVDQHNFPENRISFYGYGNDQPIAPNDTEENNAKNRRVEITLVLD